MAGWRVVLTPEAAAVVRGLAPDLKRSVRDALESLGRAPNLGKELQRELHGLRSYKARRYRIVYEVRSPSRALHVVAVGHRSDVYEQLADVRLAGRAAPPVGLGRRGSVDR